MKVTDQDINLLQFNGLISDNCVHWEDVAEVDRAKALEFLEKQRKAKQ